MKKIFALFAFIFILLSVFLYKGDTSTKSLGVLSSNVKPSYWLLLHRKSNIEYLFQGLPGEKDKSTLVKTFTVKTGIPGQSPTPLPRLLGKEYWIITNKEDSSENLETAPYFLTLDIPVTDDYPFGPTSYNECSGQCDWQMPGYFGLHGVNGNEQKLSSEDPGSSGCIRHFDEDIIYLYNLLNPEVNEVRYYIEDI
ncbi:MAG: hypothetical protein A3D74_05450 [Candidatus Levybacteria bacterium RIFCSPHIGHO2_02_FULL_37_13]|nr:MAG: hypothetical protein A3D74_05450 [Candidatus Levybacteria bacterium RIFCSPHIGHO2_02_FULL_37_13]OGH30384.1 MAG: hypothetical protein A3E40_04055 [Candidatus Levybacteria bacterium RIFCSPHIGHO2_12_FULL_37_9]OGH40390.1 MAG: hypothetical protein A3B41_02675 [Candidatus Levybacteria bacterium RIFCSPLOWO2_01_FULL_37_26]